MITKVASLLLQRLVNKFIGGKLSCDAADLQSQYERERQPHAFAPHPVDIYRGLLRQIRLSDQVIIPSVLKRDYPRGSKGRLFLRHDVDTVVCVDKLGLMLEANIAEAVPAVVYIRTDGLEYQSDDLMDTVKRYREVGVEFGLHTSCYLHDDYFAAFSRETEKFSKTFEFQPWSFTVHGLGEVRLNTRLSFVQEIIARLAEFGYVYTDCSRSYTYVITDCHPDPISGRRFIYNDFLHLPNFFMSGRDYLVLTHPCYWR